MPHAHTQSAAATPPSPESAYSSACDEYEAATLAQDADRVANASHRLGIATRDLAAEQSARLRPPAATGPTWDQLLSDPEQQLDHDRVVLKSIGRACSDLGDPSDPTSRAAHGWCCSGCLTLDDPADVDLRWT